MGIDSNCTITATAACEDVTRIVVVKDGSSAEYWADSWRVSVQDAGRTIKFFANGDGAAAIEERAAELAGMLGISEAEAAKFAQRVAPNGGQLDRLPLPADGFTPADDQPGLG